MALRNTNWRSAGPGDDYDEYVRGFLNTTRQDMMRTHAQFYRWSSGSVFEVRYISNEGVEHDESNAYRGMEDERVWTIVPHEQFLEYHMLYNVCLPPHASERGYHLICFRGTGRFYP